MKIYQKILLIAILGISIFVQVFSQNTVTILSPSPATILSYEQHLDFTVSTSIDNFSPSDNYWIVITTVKSDETYFRNDVEQDRERVIKTMERWEADLFWPKYIVKGNPYTGHIFDGSRNPFPFLQPMFIMVIKVDDSFNQFIINWFKTAPPKFEGIPVSKLKPEMIVAKRGIFFE